MKEDEPNSRITIDSSSSAVIKNVKESNNLQRSKEPLFDNAEIRYFTNDASFDITFSAPILAKTSAGFSPTWQ
jgi:hypothetical protein